MTEKQMGRYMWRHQGHRTIKDIAHQMGVDTQRARLIYDREIMRKLGKYE